MKLYFHSDFTDKTNKIYFIVARSPSIDLFYCIDKNFEIFHQTYIKLTNTKDYKNKKLNDWLVFLLLTAVEIKKHQVTEFLLDNEYALFDFSIVYSEFKKIRFLDEKRDLFFLYRKKRNDSKSDDFFLKNKYNQSLEKYFRELEREIFPITRYPIKLFDSSTSAQNAEMYLFYWCVLANKIETAKIFWKKGKVSRLKIL